MSVVWSALGRCAGANHARAHSDGVPNAMQELGPDRTLASTSVDAALSL